MAVAAARGEVVKAEIEVTPRESEEGPEGYSSCCKASSGTNMNGSSTTPRRSPGSRFDTPTRRIPCRSEATKCSSS